MRVDRNELESWNATKVMLIQRDETVASRQRRGADEQIMRADQGTRPGQFSPQFGMSTGIDESEWQNGNGVEDRFDEGGSSRANAGVRGTMTSVEQLGRRDDADRDGIVVERIEKRLESKRPTLGGDEHGRVEDQSHDERIGGSSSRPASRSRANDSASCGESRGIERHRAASSLAESLLIDRSADAGAR